MCFRRYIQCRKRQKGFISFCNFFSICCFCCLVIYCYLRTTAIPLVMLGYLSLFDQTKYNQHLFCFDGKFITFCSQDCIRCPFSSHTCFVFISCSVLFSSLSLPLNFALRPPPLSLSLSHPHPSLSLGSLTLLLKLFLTYTAVIQAIYGAIRSFENSLQKWYSIRFMTRRQHFPCCVTSLPSKSVNKTHLAHIAILENHATYNCIQFN